MDSQFNALDKVRTMLRIFCAQNEGFHICHINARSIKSKVHELNEMFCTSNVDAILVSESWLNPYISNNILNLDGYKLFRCDRTDRVGGGVAIYLKDYVKARIIKHFSDCGIEFLAVEVMSDFDKFLLGVVYCPPNNFSLESVANLDAFLEYFSRLYSNILIEGDWNINLLVSSSFTNTFRYFLFR